MESKSIQERNQTQSILPSTYELQPPIGQPFVRVTRPGEQGVLARPPGFGGWPPPNLRRLIKTKTSNLSIDLSINFKMSLSRSYDLIKISFHLFKHLGFLLRDDSQPNNFLHDDVLAFLAFAAAVLRCRCLGGCRCA